MALSERTPGYSWRAVLLAPMPFVPNASKIVVFQNSAADVSGAGVRVGAGEQGEAGLQTAAQIIDAAEAKLAAVDAVLAQRQALGGTVILDVAAVQVDRAVERDRRLCRRRTSESAEHCESEQRFFHCNYLLG